MKCQLLQKDKEPYTKTSTATSSAIQYQPQSSPLRYCVGSKTPPQKIQSSTLQDHIFNKECQSLSSLSPTLFGNYIYYNINWILFTIILQFITVNIISLGLSKWENIGILSEVLANSQQEYLDSLKRQHNDKENTSIKHSCDTNKPSTSQ